MKSYLKFLSRNISFAIIQAFGLFSSMTFIIIIGCYVIDNYKIVHENPFAKSIYIFGMPDYYGLTYGFKEVAKERIPEIQSITQIHQGISATSEYKGERFIAKAMAIDEDFFEIFPNYKLIEGNIDNIKSKNNVFISETLARTYGIEVGDELKIATDYYIVQGLFKDFKNTLLNDTDILVSWMSPVNDNVRDNPFDLYGSTIPLVKLYPGTDINLIIKKVEDICKEYYSIYENLFFQSLSCTRLDKIYFDETIRSDQFNQGDWGTLRILIAVGILLLISAIFNYINLSTALTGKRIKEMATRRLVGANRSTVVIRFIFESMLFTFVCFGIAILLAYAFAPIIDSLLNSPNIQVRVHLSFSIFIYYLLIIIGVGILSGVIPALIAAKYTPIDVVKGAYRASNKRTYSKIFIVIQNCLAIFLLTMGLVMEFQYKKSLNRPMNFNHDNKFYLSLWLRTENTGLYEELIKIPGVKRVGRTSSVPGFIFSGQYGKDVLGNEVLFRLCRMDSIAFDMLEFIKLKDFNIPKAGSVWLSENTYNKIGFSDTVNDISLTELPKRTKFIDNTAGTFKDFPYNTSNTGEEELVAISVISDKQMDEIFYNNWLIETQDESNEIRNKILETYRKWSVKRLGTVWELSGADFINSHYKKGLEPAKNNMRLLEIFMILSLIISILGLIAMSTYYANVNSKSIAIRKIYGGTVKTEAWRSIGNYMILIIISCLIAVPFAVWAVRSYLEEYIYRIENYWWIIAIAILLSLITAFLSVLWQTLRAANVNPAIELKKE